MAENIRLSLNEINVLEVCHNIEVTCANLYRYFSDIYADNSKASKLWGKTAVEEDTHAEQFKLAIRLMGNGIHSLKTDLNKVNAILTKIETIYENVQKSPPSLNEALRLAINMENALSNYHMDTIAKFDNVNLAELFTSMMSNDKEHIQSLEKAYKEFAYC